MMTPGSHQNLTRPCTALNAQRPAGGICWLCRRSASARRPCRLNRDFLGFGVGIGAVRAVCASPPTPHTLGATRQRAGLGARPFRARWRKKLCAPRDRELDRSVGSAQNLCAPRDRELPHNRPGSDLEGAHLTRLRTVGTAVNRVLCRRFRSFFCMVWDSPLHIAGSAGLNRGYATAYP